MKVGDVVAWIPHRGASWYDQKVKFVGIVTAAPSEFLYDGDHRQCVSVIWNESTKPTLNDTRDLRVLEKINEDW